MLTKISQQRVAGLLIRFLLACSVISFAACKKSSSKIDENLAAFTEQVVDEQGKVVSAKEAQDYETAIEILGLAHDDSIHWRPKSGYSLDAGGNQLADSKTLVRLNAVLDLGGAESGGALRQIRWVQESGPVLQIENADKPEAQIRTPEVEDPVELTFRVAAVTTDNYLLTSTTSVTVQPITVDGPLPGVGPVSKSYSSSSKPSSASSGTSGSNGSINRLVQSEEFVRYFDLTDSQDGNCPSGDPVDMLLAFPGEPGSCNVGRTLPGEWLEYDVYIAQSNDYYFAISLGSQQSNQTVAVSITQGQATQEFTFPVPRVGWSAFREVVADVYLDAGLATVRVEFITGLSNFDYFQIREERMPDTPQSTDVLAIKSGSDFYVDVEGTHYVSDAPYALSGCYTSTCDDISATDDSILYRQQRDGLTSGRGMCHEAVCDEDSLNGNFGYAIPLQNGLYDITVKMAELYWQSAGARVFDAVIEDRHVIEDLDIFELVGHGVALDIFADSIEVSDGQLDISFTATVDAAVVSAIVVRRVDASSIDEGNIGGNRN